VNKLRLTFLERELKKQKLEFTQMDYAYLIAIKDKDKKVWEQFVRLINHINEVE
jgi:hypothetical protein